MAVIIDPESTPQDTLVRVGTRHPSSLGPLGSATWESETVRRRDSDGRVHETVLYYQERTLGLIEHAHIRVHGDIEVPCHRATREQLGLMDATFALVPPPHLHLVNQRKPQGFLISSSTGRGGDLSYTGGANVGRDDRSTPDYDERRLILITHGALWENRDLGICPTVLHEIGHVLTHRGEINYGPFPEERAEAMGASRASRNPGQFEALCNAYMYLLCYGASGDDIRRYGTLPEGLQKDSVTRDALRRCPAFSARMLDDSWRTRYAER